MARERKTVVRVVFIMYILINNKAINGFSIYKIPAIAIKWQSTEFRFISY